MGQNNNNSSNSMTSSGQTCPRCGSTVGPDMVFCTNCGAKITKPGSSSRFCIQCGNPLDDEMDFCTSCGAKVTREDAASVPQQHQCPDCGAFLPEGLNFCTECGNPLSGNRRKKNSKIIPILLVIAILVVVAALGALAIFMLNSPAEPTMEDRSEATEHLSLVSPGIGVMTGLRTEATTEPWTEATMELKPETATESSTAPATAHTHYWQAATCTDPKICLVCGETDEIAPGHDWISASCSSPCICRNCGATEGTALEHIWEPATPSTPKTCVNCGITEGDPLPAATYLNEMPYSNKYGKLWTRSEIPFNGTVHSKADHPTCWSDMNTPGHTQGLVLDSRGNMYKYGLHLDGDMTTAYYITYNLDGLYTTFSGTCAYPGEVISTQWAPKYTKCFYVYADGVLLYTSSQMNKDTEPAPFSLNVTGVKELRIVYPASDGPNEIATLFDGKLE